MNFENENKKHTTVEVLRNKHFYWPFFWCISLMDLLFIAMRFEMKKKGIECAHDTHHLPHTMQLWK